MSEPVVALLRGINVGGRNRLPMADLRAIADDCGFAGAKTYLQSGNIVLPATSEAPIRVAEVLRAAITDATGMEIAVIARSASAWEQVLVDNPFRAEAADGTKVHVVFLESAATTEVRELDLDCFVPERMVVSVMELFLSLPNGMGRSKLAAALARISNSDGGTVRNWNSVVALGEMAQRV